MFDLKRKQAKDDALALYNSLEKFQSRSISWGQLFGKHFLNLVQRQSSHNRHILVQKVQVVLKLFTRIITYYASVI